MVSRRINRGCRCGVVRGSKSPRRLAPHLGTASGERVCDEARQRLEIAIGEGGRFAGLYAVIRPCKDCKLQQLWSDGFPIDSDAVVNGDERVLRTPESKYGNPDSFKREARFVVESP